MRYGCCRFLHHKNPPTWAGVEPVALGVQEQDTHPPLPDDAFKLKRRITTTSDGPDSNTLRRVRTEMDYQLDASPVPKGSHIEHLGLCM
ncbi:hypothetical protein TNCV_1983111 [Trichonephila clavipes]|nr:hypothetical protein TNCV_1983111 [Trichonephila clavipes]